jgi:drug/metabolite transporter (DMT)-like permease
MKQRTAYTYALLSVLCWSTVGSAFKITLRFYDYLQLLLVSSFVAVCVLLVIHLLRTKRTSLRMPGKRDLLHSAFLGFLNPFLYYIVLFKAYSILPAQEAAALNYSWPLALVLLSIPMLKQKIGLLRFLAILLSFTGILIISTHGVLNHFTFSNPLGVALAVGSAVIWALYWIFNMKDPREAIPKLFLNFSFGFLYILIVCLWKGDLHLAPWQGLTGSVYVGLLEMGITFVLWLNALTASNSTAKVSNLIFLSPFLSLIFIHFIVGEPIYLSTLTGLVFIVGGILLQQSIRSRPV